MEINNTLDLLMYIIFTLLVLIAGLPMGMLCTIGGLRLFKKYRFKDIPENTLGRAYGKKPLEILIVGLFILIGSLWYLFIDRGGQLFNLVVELEKLMK